MESKNLKKLRRVVIKEELVELTGDFRSALVLNQFIYWSDRRRDTDNYLLEEFNRASKYSETEGYKDLPFANGWIYKSAEELNEELMIGMSKPTIRKYIKELVDKGYLDQRTNPKYKWDKTLQYRVNLIKIQEDLNKLGYSLEGYELRQKHYEIKKELPLDQSDNPSNTNSNTNNNNNITDNGKEINNSIPKLVKGTSAYEFALKCGMCDEEGNQYI